MDSLKILAGCTLKGCNRCSSIPVLPDIRMAFQPIIDVSQKQVLAYEALVRGTAGEGAGFVFSQIGPEQVFAFDQLCRIRALETATRLGLAQTNTLLSINVDPVAVFHPQACLERTLKTAQELDYPSRHIIFEITEHQKIDNMQALKELFRTYRRYSFQVALDDFGSGYAGLQVLSELRPDILKLDRALIHGIDTNPFNRAMVEALCSLCQSFSITVIAEGVENPAEYRVMQNMGVHLYQGFLFARPAVEKLPRASFPAD